RIISKFWQASCEPVLPAFGTKRLGVRKIFGMSVIHPLAHQDRIPALDTITTKFQIGSGLSSDHIDRWEQPHGLGGHGRGVSEFRQVLSGWCGTPKNALPFR